VEGPPALDARLLEKNAAAAGIVIETGDVHFLSDSGPKNFFRLGFSSIALERIEPGIRLLAQVIEQQLAGAPEKPDLALTRARATR
jgi:GntR family transcriptional regulator/MocR family aminotransferase